MQVGEALKRFGISDSGKGSGASSAAVTDIIVASIHKSAPDVSTLSTIMQYTSDLLHLDSFWVPICETGLECLAQEEPVKVSYPDLCQFPVLWQIIMG